MSLTYRLIDNAHAETIWTTEQSAPRWFRDAGAAWVATFDEYVELLWTDGEVWGLFDQDNLVAAVFIESIAPTHINVHVSVIGEVKPDELVRFFVSLKNQKAIEGVTVIVGWLLGKNRGLLRVAEKAGFSVTGLRMLYGVSRSRPMEWIQVRAA